MLHLDMYLFPDASLHPETHAFPDACINLNGAHPSRFASPPTHSCNASCSLAKDSFDTAGDMGTLTA
jgi:hypothetical protein